MKTQETGRSMIEMLGVLAIIGVLSVGGIAGYTTAMRSYKANEIINATSMLFMEGLASNVGEGTSPMDLDSNMLPSGCGSIHYKGDKATLTVNIEDETICKQVKTKLGDKAGDCIAATGSGASGYTLTVTLGKTNSPYIPESEWPEADPGCIESGAGSERDCKCFAAYNGNDCGTCIVCNGGTKESCEDPDGAWGSYGLDCSGW